MSLDLQSLIAKLDSACRKNLEKAAEMCVAQTNYNVEIEHLILSFLYTPDTDIRNLLRYYDIRSDYVTKELIAAIDAFKRGNSRTPSLSPQIIHLLEEAWLLSSLYLNEEVIRSGTVFLALLENDTLRGLILESSPSLKKIPQNSVKQDILKIIRMSTEKSSGADTVEQGKGRSETPSLDLYTVNLTDRAEKGMIDPIQGRDPEIRQIIDILTRRRQNNPILTGEAGVGKTAVVEGFALQVAAKDVPPTLQNISLRLLDLGLLQAGAGIKGEFEKRLKSVIDEVKKSPTPIILFIDEAHTMIGAGGPAGMGDAANMLKPALARGELRTIAVTTWSEYKKYFEKDPALARRFQVVKVSEPDEESAVDMLRCIVPNLERHHNVFILDQAVKDAVRFSLRYISGRQLPDKAISVLDTACARVEIGQNTTPSEIEDLARRMEQINLELNMLKREKAVAGPDSGDRVRVLEKKFRKTEKQRKEREQDWKRELKVAREVLELQKKIEIESNRKNDREIDLINRKLNKKRSELEKIIKDEPMVPVCVDSRIVASVISSWTGIPVGKMLTDEIETILTLRQRMEEKIIGQSQAISTICRRIQTYRANLDDPGKPVGVFLLAGPSGIGKTETAITLTDLLYGGDSNMIVVNMSEYQEAHSVSRLKGSPPGYVGYGQGGVLTEAVRHNPYSLVLLDEVEKAHPDVIELFYQVFDKGRLEDSEGITVDFKNTVIILTSNIGSTRILEACRDAEKIPDSEELVRMIRPDLFKYFKPALLGRLVIVPYFPLDSSVIQHIVRLKLEKIQERFRDNHRIKLSYSNRLVEVIAAGCTEVETGARNVDHTLTQIILPELSVELLNRMALGEICTDIYLYIDASGAFRYRFEPPISKGKPAGFLPSPSGYFEKSYSKNVKKIGSPGKSVLSGSLIKEHQTLTRQPNKKNLAVFNPSGDYN